VGGSRTKALFQVHPTLMQDAAHVQIEPWFLAHVFQFFGQIGGEGLPLIRRCSKPVAQFPVVNAFRGLSKTFGCIVGSGDQIVKGLHGILIPGHN